MNTLLEAQNLVKRYGDRVVVKDIDLIVSPGEVVGALIGPNGAGKSTTLEMVLGCVCPIAGRSSSGAMTHAATSVCNFKPRHSSAV